MTKSEYLLLLSAVLCGLSACGRGSSLPDDVTSVLSAALAPSATATPARTELGEAVPKILLGLAEIKQQLHQVRLSPAATPHPAVSPAPQVRPSAAPAASAVPSPAASAQAPDAQAELQLVLSQMANAPFASANIDKREKSFADGHVSTQQLKMWVKQPNLVKLEVQNSSSGGAGTKVLYTSDVGDKVKVRPGGALGFAVIDVGKHEDAADSTNRYTLDQLDLFGIVRRLRQGYSAELVGKTQLNGSEIHILKLTATGTNSLDARITYEYLGYEPATHKLALWETYSAASSDPYMRIVISKLAFPASLPDSTFKI